jgi:hypothetical protein
MQKVLLHCQISADLRKKLGEAVDKLGKTTGDIVEEALSFYLESPADTETKELPKKATPKPSSKAAKKEKK